MTQPLELNSEYTEADHLFRDIDPYAGAKYDITMRWLEPYIRTGMSLYNVGCGAGFFNEVAATRGLAVSACEPDAIACGLARKRPSAATQDIAPVGFLDFAKGRAPADFVIMHDVLEHIEDDRQATETLRSMVAPGGRAIVSVPAMPSLFGLHDEELGHYRRYRSAELKALLAPSFEIVRFRFFGFTSIPIAFYFSRLRRVPYPIGGTAGPLGKAFAFACGVETRVPAPIGTSLICELLPRA